MIVNFDITMFLVVGAKSAALPVHLLQNNSLGQGDMYSIYLIDTDTGRVIWREDSGHYGVIYDLVWSKDDSYLSSCGGDGMIKVWDMISLIPSNAISDLNISENPLVCHRYYTSPPTPVYTIIFQEYSSSIKKTDSIETDNFFDRVTKSRIPCPTIISGSADGRIRCWNEGNLVGFLHLGSEFELEPAHRHRVQSLAINERSRYLFSGDSAGEVLIWRLDNQNQYKLLRKLRRDSLASTDTLPSTAIMTVVDEDSMHHSASGVMTMFMHPDKKRNQMLLMQHQPSQLKVYNLANYRLQSKCNGFQPAIHSTGKTIFQRAALSADGSFVVCGTAIRASTGNRRTLSSSAVSNKGDQVVYRLSLWDSQTGASIRTELSEYHYPYPVRSISWHPKQHALAVAFMGEQAAVVIYAGMKDK